MNPDAAKPPTCLIQNQPELHSLCCFVTDQKNAGFPVPIESFLFLFLNVSPVSRLLITYNVCTRKAKYNNRSCNMRLVTVWWSTHFPLCLARAQRGAFRIISK